MNWYAFEIIGVNMKRVNILNEKMMAALLKLAWPAVITMLFQTVYNMVDAYWLGKLGKVEISAPTIAWPAIFLLISIGGGLAVAGLALVSQNIGAGKKEEASHVAGQVISISFIVAVVLGLLGAVFSEMVLKLLSIPPELLSVTNTYMRTIFLGAPFTFTMFTFNSLFTAIGDTKTPMYLMGISVSVNAVLDPLLIFGIGFPRLEVFGAALATVVSRGLIVIVATVILFKGKRGFKVQLKDLWPRWKTLTRVLRIGLPSSAGQSITALAFLIITSIVARFGSVATAALGVGNRITSLATMFSFGLSQATSSMVGQYLGAGRKNDAYSVVWKATGINVLIVGIICTGTFFFGKEVTAFFIDDPLVLIEGEKYFRIVSFSIPFFASYNIFDMALRGSGHTVQSMVLNISRLWAIRLPLIYIFGLSLGTTGIWYAMLISNLVIALVAAVVILSKSWLNPVI
ncbi:MAG: MATE efflux family protein [Mesotoga prima]|uniref:Multidrug-efflux transporter n=2 Tax=Mesotoga TaxID=1184396 RepID=A0A101HQU2_9BACT|nr:MAG: MATE efflux family protein [Mesotoga prima]